MANICENYPCHELINGFSCKYCYCPLYEMDCKLKGGNPKYVGREQIKDCSNCILPHKPNFKGK